ncbi:MAG: peptidylprolyl isomerase [Bacteroidia bacterium]
MRRIACICLACWLLLIGCGKKTSETDISAADVKLVTEEGDIYIDLFEDTPKHKENFLKLAASGFYEDLTFHRVVKNLMVQAGNPKLAGKSDKEDAGYELAAEISDKYVHTRGMLAAARVPDMQNPLRKSSGSQFFIVTGKPTSDDTLTLIENYISQLQFSQDSALMKTFLAKPEILLLENRLKACLQAGKNDSIPLYQQQMMKVFEQFAQEKGLKRFKYSDEQRKLYKTVGGACPLDMQYTIFGKVIKGMEVVETIENGKTHNEIPAKPIHIQKVEILKK